MTLIPKPDKDTTRKLQTSISDKPNAKLLNKISTNYTAEYTKRIIHNDLVEFIPGIQGWYNICKSVSVTHHNNEGMEP